MQRKGALASALIVLLLSLPLSRKVEAASGDLDPTFGNGGKVTTIFSPGITRASALVIQPDGKIVTAGFSSSLDSDFALARYNTDGSLDPTFGTGGKVTTDFANEADLATSLALQPDGKIVAAGWAEDVNDNQNFALVRYNANGQQDATFGAGGKVVTDFEFGAFALAVAIQPNGKILAAGQATLLDPSLNFVGDFALVRYNPDGSPDLSFGTGGKVTTDFFGFSDGDMARAMVLQPDGKIILAGQADVQSRPFSFDDFALARYNADGSLDSTFGTGGKVKTDFGGDDEANGVALQPDGKIIAAGTSTADFALARYNSNGSLDPSFGSGGKVTTDILGGTDEASAVTIQADGKVIAAGTANTAIFVGDFALARYNINGGLDPAFGSGGKVTTDFDNDDEASAVALQTDGKIVVAGSSGGGDNFALARYKGDSAAFDFCIEDDSGQERFQFSSITGRYQYTSCLSNTVIGGTGGVDRRGRVISLQHFAPDRRVLTTVNTRATTGTVSIQVLSSRLRISITDRDTTNNLCACR